jgi:hypothetical protein
MADGDVPMKHTVDAGPKIVQLDDQFFADILSAAVNGGIGYWAEVVAYNTGGNPAHNKAVLLVQVEHPDEPPTEYTVDLEVIRNGVQLMLSHRPDRPDSRSSLIATYGQMHEWLTDACLDPENGTVMVDADTADAVVQFGLFEEITFG